MVLVFLGLFGFVVIVIAGLTLMLDFIEKIGTMDSKKVISRKNLPTKSPVSTTVLFFLALDYWNAPQWIWGAVGFFMVCVWIVTVISYFKEESIDVINEQ